MVSAALHRHEGKRRGGAVVVGGGRRHREREHLAEVGNLAALVRERHQLRHALGERPTAGAAAILAGPRAVARRHGGAVQDEQRGDERLAAHTREGDGGAAAGADDVGGAAVGEQGARVGGRAVHADGQQLVDCAAEEWRGRRRV